MLVLDSATDGFEASRCKYLLELTVMRTRQLRNWKEAQHKLMREDVANLLETGEGATVGIRVDHIIRGEKMMAALEIIEIFCGHISFCIPTIEAQSECPSGLRESISSVCFAAPRCDHLPELLQVQLIFASKYGEEFVAAATNHMPDSGVNRQLVELLSFCTPSAEKRSKLLKNITEMHGVEWDPAASKAELFVSRENLLDGSTQVEEVLRSASMKAADALLVQGPVTGHDNIADQASEYPTATEHVHSLPLMSDTNHGLQDVVAAANAAVEAAQRAAAAAHFVALLAELRISQLPKNTIPEKPVDLNTSVFTLFDGQVNPQHLPSTEDRTGKCSADFCP